LKGAIKLEGKKFLGIGLKSGLSMALFTMLVIVMVKVIFNKYPVRGITEIINTV
jgi:hypothetical protein